ncbi:hypothetical protein [Ekhidna sp. To15]|uniref:hypothetical protein n=1 Tax=Ekhidna sp. To15 TaxID=3395267 RepID=UPI003F52337F
MEQNAANWKDYHHQIYQIYHGIIAITLIPFALLFLEWDSGNKEGTIEGLVFILLTQLLWVVGYLSWYAWKGKKVQYSLKDQMSINQKMGEFKKRNLMKYGLLAAGGMVAAGAMWIAPSFLFVVAYFGVLVQYSFLRPSEDKFVRDMRLTKEERMSLHEET